MEEKLSRNKANLDVSFQIQRIVEERGKLQEKLMKIYQRYRKITKIAVSWKPKRGLVQEENNH